MNDRHHRATLTKSLLSQWKHWCYFTITTLNTLIGNYTCMVTVFWGYQGKRWSQTFIGFDYDSDYHYLVKKNVNERLNQIFPKVRSVFEAHVGAESAGGEQRLDGGSKAHNVEHGSRRKTLQCYHHGFLWIPNGWRQNGVKTVWLLICGSYVWCWKQITLTRWMLLPLMLPLRSTRNSSSLVALCSSCGSHSRSGQKLSINTGLFKMSLWYRFLTNSSWR